MSEVPWITIVGLGEDGPAGLSDASREALREASVVMGPKRHLSLLSGLTVRQVEWPVPFAKGIDVLKDLRGQKVVVLASGDPFWYGAGSVIARHFAPGDWRALPNVSVFSLAASRMGWPLEKTLCAGLHAAPLANLRAHLAPGVRAIVLLRDGDAVGELAAYLNELGFGETRVTAMQALGGPREQVREFTAKDAPAQVDVPVCVAIEVAGQGRAMPQCSGLPDAVFETDGVMTKRPIRALTLSALAPGQGELLWDIGGGSGSIAIEWLMSHPSCEAVVIEPKPERLALIRANAAALGVNRLQIVEGIAPDALASLSTPDVVFIGGGLSQEMLEALEAVLPSGTRLVANSVTLEAEHLLLAAQARLGGDLMRVEIATVAPLGSKRGWKASYPLVQWSIQL